MHGKTSQIKHDGRGVYKGLSNPFEAPLYPSLIVTGASLLSFVCSSRSRHTRLVSDWSSDVCSSDLLERVALAGKFVRAERHRKEPLGRAGEFFRRIELRADRGVRADQHALVALD